MPGGVIAMSGGRVCLSAIAAAAAPLPPVPRCVTWCVPSQTRGDSLVRAEAARARSELQSIGRDARQHTGADRGVERYLLRIAGAHGPKSTGTSSGPLVNRTIVQTGGRRPIEAEAWSGTHGPERLKSPPLNVEGLGNSRCPVGKGAPAPAPSQRARGDCAACWMLCGPRRRRPWWRRGIRRDDSALRAGVHSRAGHAVSRPLRVVARGATGADRTPGECRPSRSGRASRSCRRNRANGSYREDGSRRQRRESGGCGSSRRNRYHGRRGRDRRDGSRRQSRSHRSPRRHGPNGSDGCHGRKRSDRGDRSHRSHRRSRS